MSDIVERLIQAHLHSSVLRGSSLLCKEAADGIERLRELLREAAPLLKKRAWSDSDLCVDPDGDDLADRIDAELRKE